MKDIILNQIFVPVIGVVISTLIGIFTYYAKKFYENHKSMIELQKQELIQKIGIDKYNQDIALVKNMVKTVEQLGKEFNWQGELKHSKVLEMIEGKTGLSDADIYNIIKASVLEVNNLSNSSGTATK